MISRSKPTIRLVCVFAVPILASLALVALVSAVSPILTKGPMPPDAAVPGQTVNASLVPDFVAVSAQDGALAGYARKQDVLDPPVASGFRGHALPIAVYGADLTTLVGYLVPDRGFVSLGVPVDSVPAAPASVAPGN